MDKQFKRRWVAALRSGKYKQGRGGLKKGDEYCCLGVACDISGDVAWEGEYAVFGGEAAGSSLPDGLQTVLGLSLAHEEHLVKLNDDRRFSFRSIANWIEKNL